MGKTALGAQTILYSTPAVIVGARVDGKPNFSTYAWCGIVNSEPPTISISMRYKHHTLKGVHQNGTFSVNIPSVDEVVETDYCGMVSGRDADKARKCNFTVYYGKLETAPLIEECPVNLECRVLHSLRLGTHEMLIGQIEEVYITDSCLTDGEPDVEKIRPFTYVVQPARHYRAYGEILGKAFSIGKQIKDRS